MSLPQFPTIDPPLTREDVINQIISSIAMEEVALSHIINAEGEKLQYVLGTVPGQTQLNPTIDQVLQVNESVRGVLQSAAEAQAALRSKLQAALSSPVMRGPTGPTGPTGPQGVVEGSGFLAELKDVGVEVELPAGEPILFNGVTYNSGMDISYDAATGVITANTSGLYDFYTLSWSVMMEGYNGTLPLSVSVMVNGVAYSTIESNLSEGQLSASVVIPTGGGQIAVTLNNSSDDILELSNLHTHAQITLVGIKAN